MKTKFWLFTLAAIAAASLPGAAGAANDTQVKVVEVAGSDTPKIVMTATVDAPPEKVWAIVSDCSTYKQHMPRIAAARELSKSGNQHTCEVTIEMPFPLSNLTAVTQATHEEAAPKFARRWKLLRGDYKINDGSWEVSPSSKDPAKSFVRYTVHAEPNTSVPQWVREKAQKKALPEMMDRIEAEAKKL